ncbi:hypothetical protein [Mycobacterium sp. 852014-52144_SCH5372336]|uniref:hypothetical protein n=1 Tax=Mycobacterium sp. 852014-52144_SCH5372336 TaxID=1834115 RepID=UPI0007FEEC94|nr:hypothetical protein [Mycobacterium sp. 852014-52144_SCH5372336]OBB74333.1 hypothetical protein A5759_12330 [Mycobacterium sp. 852014-52144_SCH5372336]
MTESEERGQRGTGSDEPSGGPVDRPSGTYQGDESVPEHDDGGKPDFETGFTNEPPKDVEPEVPPYAGRQTSAKPEGPGDDGGERTAGAVKPATDAASKAPSPSETGGGATASPADEQPASQMPESDRGNDRVGPSHTVGTGRAEDKR